MAFQKGRRKTGGRKKGTENKTTSDIRKIIYQLINSEAIVEDLKELEPKERLEFIVKLLPYALPKYKQESDNTDWFGV